MSERLESGDRVGTAARPRRVVRTVNDRIRELAGSDVELTWEFLCECGDPDCHAFLSLTLREYDRVRGAGIPRPLLAHDV
jgi:hypothetical protein